MSKKQKRTASEKKPSVEAEKPEIEAPGEATAMPRSRIVDTVFDAVTGWAARGLTAAKDTLERGARWLDARAKGVGAVATKLAPAHRAPDENRAA